MLAASDPRVVPPPSSSMQPPRAAKRSYCSTISVAFWCVLFFTVLVLGIGATLFTHGILRQENCKQDYTLPGGGLKEYQDCRDRVWIEIVIGIACGCLFIVMCFISCCAFMDCCCFQRWARVPPHNSERRLKYEYSDRQLVRQPMTTNVPPTMHVKSNSTDLYGYPPRGQVRSGETVPLVHQQQKTTITTAVARPPPPAVVGNAAAPRTVQKAAPPPRPERTVSLLQAPGGPATLGSLLARQPVVEQKEDVEERYLRSTMSSTTTDDGPVMRDSRSFDPPSAPIADSSVSSSYSSVPPTSSYSAVAPPARPPKPASTLYAHQL